MEYTYKTYSKETDRTTGEHKIATISDLNLDIKATRGELEDLFLNIHDKFPEYIFLLGNIFPYYYLESKEFKKNILHLLKLLTLISKVYIVFGETDYKTRDNSIVEEKYLEDFYQSQGVNVLNNKIERINGFSLIGYNRSPFLYKSKSNITLKEDILNFISKIEDTLNNDTYKIFLTNTHKDILKLELDFFKTLDLVISGELPKEKEIQKQGLLERKKKKEDHNLLETNGLTIIGNGGINVNENSLKGEIDLIRIKSKKR